MKRGTAIAVIALMVAPSALLGQPRQSDSDDYLCNHGAQGAEAATQACARLHNPNSEPDEQTTASAAATSISSPSPRAAPPLPPQATSAALIQQGQFDRTRYEAWTMGLRGEFAAGARYWEAHRSVQGAGGCNGPGSPATSPQWTQGCLADQQQLNESDRLRRSSPDYRAGWNQPVLPAQLQTPGASNDTTTNAPTGQPSPSIEPYSSPVPAAAPPAQTTSSFSAVALGVLVVLLLIGFLLAVYFLPTLIAAGRKKRNMGAIFALNLFLGWTLLGWVLALVWSLSVDP